MSQAFVKEIDDAPPPPLPERPLPAGPNLVTQRGARLIEAEAARLEAALAQPPADEEKAALLRRDLRYWGARRASMQIVPPHFAPTTVGLGVRVTMQRGRRKSTVDIVGDDEADPSAGRLAWTSPLAQALEGAEPGEVVEFARGDQVEPVTVLALAPVDD